MLKDKINNLLKEEKDYYKVDLDIVKKHDSNSHYIGLVKKEIKNGNGLVQIHSTTKGMAEIYAADSVSYLLGGIWIPKESLTFVK